VWVWWFMLHCLSGLGGVVFSASGAAKCGSHEGALSLHGGGPASCVAIWARFTDSIHWILYSLDSVHKTSFGRRNQRRSDGKC
jgi:hypothetical protein